MTTCLATFIPYSNIISHIIYPDDLKDKKKENEIYQFTHENSIISIKKPIKNPKKKLSIQWINIFPNTEKDMKSNFKNIPNDEIEEYDRINQINVKCEICKNEFMIVDCIRTLNECGYMCLNCAAEVLPGISYAKDWEKDIITNHETLQCDRLKHKKPIHSFIKFSFKNNKYELSHLCIFCRNIKKIEYLMKKIKGKVNNKKRIVYKTNL